MPSIKEYFPGLKGGVVTLEGISIADLGDILDANKNEILEFDTVASAVNNVRIANAATTGRPVVSAVGDDTNVGLDIEGKGSGTIRLGNVSTGNIEAIRALVGSLGITSISPTAGVGYATGAGGAVTQITNASTGVTLSKVTGQITTVALTTAAAAEEEFTVTNTAVAATDVIAVSTTYAGAGTPAVSVKGVAAGSFVINITNLHAANALNAVLIINFAVIKGVAA